MSGTPDAITRVECDWCEHVVRLRKDDTYGVHYYQVHGQKTRCKYSERPHSRHMGTFRVIKRDEHGKATVWLAECRCGEAETGPDYDDVEKWHTGHCKAAAAASDGSVAR